MTNLMVAFLMLLVLFMAVLLLLIIFLSGALLVFAREAKSEKQRIKSLGKPKKSMS
ncbi:MAG TPA: hypothetical protein VLK23_15955 [Thermodesulfobacteriota bacterium]|nr:hypothetical protein [Thermodesulfobacteriota bacterium]